MANPFQFGRLTVWGYLKSLITQVSPTEVFGVPIVIRFSAVALTGDVDIIVNEKMRVIEVWARNTAAGGAGDTVTVKNGSTAITNAIDMNAADDTVVRVTTIAEAQQDVAAGGTLRVTGASAVNADVYVMGILVA